MSSFSRNVAHFFSRSAHEQIVVVRVRPGSRKGPLVEVGDDDSLTIYVPERAVDAEANDAVIKLLAATPRRAAQPRGVDLRSDRPAQAFSDQLTVAVPLQPAETVASVDGTHLRPGAGELADPTVRRRRRSTGAWPSDVDARLDVAGLQVSVVDTGRSSAPRACSAVTFCSSTSGSPARCV